MNNMESILKTHLTNGLKTEVSVKKKQEIEHILQGNIKPQRGHFIWELNEETGNIKKAEFKSNTAAIFGANKMHDKLIVNPNCIYIPALNNENAKKKYLKNKEQSTYYSKPPLMKLSDIYF